MIQHSDNACANRCINIFGIAKLNALLAGGSLGLMHTRLQRLMLDSAAAARDQDNVTTPMEMARLLERMARRDVPGGGDMIETLRSVDCGGWRPRGSFRDAIPPQVPVASKPGAVRGVQAEAGVVFLPKRPFVLTVFFGFLPDEEETEEDGEGGGGGAGGGGSGLVAIVAEIVFKFFQTAERCNSTGAHVE
jgi:beta-lactamase class A